MKDNLIQLIKKKQSNYFIGEGEGVCVAGCGGGPCFSITAV